MPRNKDSGNHSNMDTRTYSSKNLDKDLQRIAGVVAKIPDVEPPEGLIESVMSRIQPKRLGWWRRFWRPLQIPISVTPLKVASVGASATALMLVALVFLLQAPEKGKVASTIQGIDTGTAPVMFSLDMPSASTVEVIGSFNRWRPEGFQMEWDERRELWVLSIQLERGKHEYAFLVDGRVIISDPRALMNQDDGFGNKNSILFIEGDNHHGSAI
jgi:hypothetical protein